jgi:opacity protein-like surface antigen
MKKLFTILCATLLSVGVFAQAETEAGTFLLSGATGLDFATQGITGSDPSDYWEPSGMPAGYERSRAASNLELKLMGGYFVADGLAVGLSVLYKSESSTDEESITGYSNSDQSTESTMMIAPTVRFYFGETGVWLQTAYGFGSLSNSNTYEETGNSSVTVDESNSMSSLQFGAGYAIALSDNISLNPSVGYAMSSVTIEDGYTTYNATTGSPVYEDLKLNMSGMTFNLGIALHLGR